jgi:hypothetical protein
VATQKVKKDQRLSKQELTREPAFNEFLRGIQNFLEGSPLPIAKIALGTLALVVIIGGVYWFYSYNKANAEKAFADALAIYNAEVKDPKAVKDPANEPKPIPGKKVYDDEKKKYAEARTAFQNAGKYSSQSFMSRYYAAICQLKLEKDKGIAELRDLTATEGVVGQLSTVALADALASDGKTDEAIALYIKLKDLAAKAGPGKSVIAPEVISYTLGQLYESQQKNPDAIKAYEEAAKSKAATRIAQQAYERIAVLDPEAARKLPTPKSDDDQQQF